MKSAVFRVHYLFKLLRTKRESPLGVKQTSPWPMYCCHFGYISWDFPLQGFLSCTTALLISSSRVRALDFPLQLVWYLMLDLLFVLFLSCWVPFDFAIVLCSENLQHTCLIFNAWFALRAFSFMLSTFWLCYRTLLWKFATHLFDI